jgi:hypothetical protein
MKYRQLSELQEELRQVFLWSASEALDHGCLDLADGLVRLSETVDNVSDELIQAAFELVDENDERCSTGSSTQAKTAVEWARAYIAAQTGE